MLAFTRGESECAAAWLLQAAAFVRAHIARFVLDSARFRAVFPRRLLRLSGAGAVAIAVALSFDSGIVLCADTTRGVPASAKIFPKHYHSHPDGARSIFLISEPIDDTVAACRHCERGLNLLQPTEYTLDRMRATIEHSMLEMSREHLDSSQESTGEASLLVALYSPSDRQCSLF